MDKKYRELERRALSGDHTAIEPFRRLSLLLDRIPMPVIRALAGYGYQPAKNMLPHHMWPNSTDQAFDILFHDIPHNAHTAALIRYRVIAPAAERIIRRPDAVQTLNSLDTTSWEFQLQGRETLEIIQNAISMLRQMTQENYYDDLCVHSHRDYIKNYQEGQLSGNFYPRDPLVRQHDQAKKDCNAISYLITERQRNDPITPPHLDRALSALADAVAPKLVGFEGASNLNGMLHGLCYFLDGMTYSWRNNAHVEAIWSYYLI